MEVTHFQICNAPQYKFVKLKRMLGHDTIYIMKDQNNVKTYDMHTCIGKIVRNIILLFIKIMSKNIEVLIKK